MNLIRNCKRWLAPTNEIIVLIQWSDLKNIICRRIPCLTISTRLDC